MLNESLLNDIGEKILKNYLEMMKNGRDWGEYPSERICGFFDMIRDDLESSYERTEKDYEILKKERRNIRRKLLENEKKENLEFNDLHRKYQNSIHDLEICSNDLRKLLKTHSKSNGIPVNTIVNDTIKTFLESKQSEFINRIAGYDFLSDEKLKSEEINEEINNIDLEIESLSQKINDLSISDPSSIENNRQGCDKNSKLQLDHLISLPDDDFINQYLSVFVDPPRDSTCDEQPTDLIDNSFIYNDPEMFFDGQDSRSISGGSLSSLSYYMFHNLNDDPLFIHSYVIAMKDNDVEKHTYNLAITEGMTLSNSDQEFKKARLNLLTQIENEWFENSHISSNNNTFFINSNKDYPDIILNCSPLQVVQHIAYISVQLLETITVKELMACKWNSPKKLEYAPNIVKHAQFFNQMSAFFRMSILHDMAYTKKCLEILQCAFETKNYLLVFIIDGATNHPSVSNLVSSYINENNHFSNLAKMVSNITSPSKKFKNYQNALDSSDIGITIPYIGPYLTNLTFINDGNSKKIMVPHSGKEVINMVKYRAIAEQIYFIKKPWASKCLFLIDKNLLTQINETLRSIGEDF